MTDGEREELRDAGNDCPGRLIVALTEEIDKLRFQLKYVVMGLSDTRDGNFVDLLVSRNVARDELTKLHDEFEAQEAVIKACDIVDWGAFDKKLLEILPGRDGLEVHEIVTAFFLGGYYADVCHSWIQFDRNKPEETEDAKTG